MLMKYEVGEPRFLPGLGTVVQPGDTVEVPDHLVDAYSGLLVPLQTEAPPKGKQARGAEEAD